MEVFQAVGIIVIALAFYAIVSLFIPTVIKNGTFEEDNWIVGWSIGSVLFCIVVYFWVANVPFFI